MPRGNIVETSKEPEWQSVDEYRDFLKHQSPTNFDWTQLFNAEINCTCCTQGAPAEAAALLKVEDQTPFSKKFDMQDVTPTGQQGETVWICADCYTNGVRPKYVYFGDIKWNSYGRKVKNRAENKGSHPW